MHICVILHDKFQPMHETMGSFSSDKSLCSGVAGGTMTKKLMLEKRSNQIHGYNGYKMDTLEGSLEHV